MKIVFLRGFALSLAAGLAIARCGGLPPEPAATLPAPALVAATEAAGPYLTLQPTEAAPAAATEAFTPATEVPPAPTEAAPLYKGIPHGVTPDGFFYLGQAGAPVTLTDYSDFL